MEPTQFWDWSSFFGFLIGDILAQVLVAGYKKIKQHSDK